MTSQMEYRPTCCSKFCRSIFKALSTPREDVQCIFFFQAEDGIRDADVTGVQTCALPISVFCLLQKFSLYVYKYTCIAIAQLNKTKKIKLQGWSQNGFF